MGISAAMRTTQAMGWVFTVVCFSAVAAIVTEDVVSPLEDMQMLFDQESGYARKQHGAGTFDMPGALDNNEDGDLGESQGTASQEMIDAAVGWEPGMHASGEIKAEHDVFEHAFHSKEFLAQEQKAYDAARKHKYKFDEKLKKE